MIEVLVAVLVLSVGLMGVGFTQAVALAKTRGAAQRTQATDLAYAMIDMMRANPLEAYRFAQLGDGTVALSQCTGATPALATPEGSVQYWKCSVARRLPGAVVNVDYAAGLATVSLTWSDSKSEATTAARTTNVTLDGRL